MQFIYYLFFACLISTNHSVDSKIVITITGIANPIGIMRIGLYNSEENFLRRSFQGKSVEVHDGEIKQVFENIPAGRYAISIFHDQNSNGKLDSNLFRIPKEPYGFSNNPSTTFGPPDFERASFIHKANGITYINIRLK